MHEPERIGADGRPALILRRMPPSGDIAPGR